MLSGVINNTDMFQSGFNLDANPLKALPSCNKINRLSNIEAYYAKKGEPIYDKEMDEDKDGVISFDEFRDYCNNSDADIKQLMENWLVYRTSKSTQETTEKIGEDSEEETEEEKYNQFTYAKEGDTKYKAVMDENSDGIISYKEYYEYCSKNAKEEKDSSGIQNKINECYKTDFSEAYGMIEAEA